MTCRRVSTLSGDRGQVRQLESPADALALQVKVDQPDIREYEGPVVLVLQVVKHAFPAILAAFQVSQRALPARKASHLT